MKICSRCGAEMPDNISFCTHCGNKLGDPVAEQPKTPGGNGQTPPPFPPGAGGNGPAAGGSASKPKSKAWKIIKRVLIGLVAVVAILFVWIQSRINSTTYIVLNSQGEVFAKNGGEKEIGIDYDGILWQVSYKPSWVRIDEKDNSLVIKCEPNTTGQDREDHITIKSGKVVQGLPVGQYGAAQYVRLSESSLTSDRSGGSIHIDVQTDGTNPQIEYPDFCRIEDKDENGFTLVVPSNNDYSRSGTVYVQEDGARASLYIAQEGKCSTCNGSGKLSCSACGGSGSTYWGMYSYQCGYCGGNGSYQCSSCNGTGYR